MNVIFPFECINHYLSRSLRLIFWSYIIFFHSLLSDAQPQNTPDSINAILNNDQLSDSLKVVMLENIGRKAIFYSYDSGMNIAHNILMIAKQANNEILYAHAYKFYGIVHAQNGDYENGVNYFMKAYQIYKSLDDKFNLAKVVNNLGGIYSFQREYIEALKMIDEALKLQKEVNDDEGYHSTLLSKAVIYNNMDSINKSLVFLDSCEDYFAKHDLKLYAYAISVRGDNYYKTKKYNNASVFFNKSLRLADSTGNQVVKIKNILDLGKLHLDLNDLTDAEQYYLNGLKLSQDSKLSESQKNAYQGLFQVYQKSGDYKKALINHILYMETKEKLNNERTAQLIQKLKYDFQQAKQSNELELYKSKLRQNKLWFAIGIIVLLSLIVTTVILISFNRIIKKNNLKLIDLNKKIENQNLEIIIQSEKLHHANEEIKQINEHLEERILMRTRELEKQNDKLSHFAFQTSHLLRGPVARIKGLLFLLKNDPETTEEDILNRLHRSTEELDEVTSKMSRGLY